MIRTQGASASSDAGIADWPVPDGVESEESQALTSDAGAVAARQGVKYQDHVAASFVLSMIADGGIKRVERETADDIMLAWQDEGPEFPEYVQVKTTGGERNWTLSEILRRDPKSRSPTSLIEKSLLCDHGAPNALFRIVSRRAVNRTLKCLILARDNRQRSKAVSDLGATLTKKYATTSKNGHDLRFWVERTVWQVASDAENLKATNQQNLVNLAELHGANPTHSHV